MKTINKLADVKTMKTINKLADVKTLTLPFGSQNIVQSLTSKFRFLKS